MAEAVIAYDRDLPEIPDRRPWEHPASHLVKDDAAPNGWRVDDSGRRPSRLLLPPKIRAAVDAWRDGGYAGASEVTRRLFAYWFDEDHEVAGFDAPFRYHFCQREAIETLVWLVEIDGRRDARALIEAHGAISRKDLVSRNVEFETAIDGRRRIRRYLPELDRDGVQDLPPENLRRFAFKMATGAGKTWVMAMAVVWSRFHRQRVSGSDLSTNFLVVAPNVIVYQRLEKDFASNRIFHALPLIPPEWKGGFSQKVILRGEAAEPDPSGNLFLTNVHQLYESRDREWTPANAVDALLGPKPAQDLAAAGRRSLLERVRALGDLVVLNDEAHHVHDEDLAWSRSLLAVHDALPHGLAAWKGDLDRARAAARDIDRPGSRIKAIVSVMMLREGWDVRNVSVVLGLRPYTSKAEILPEQVIGRGLRPMTGVSPDRTQTLEVLGTRNLLRVLREQLEAEGVGVASARTAPPPPVVVEPVRERLAYDVEIPITRPSLRHDLRKLSELDVAALDAIFEQEELAEPYRIRLEMEFATTETEVHQDDVAAAPRPSRELLADVANLVAQRAGLTNRFAELYPVVRGYVTDHCVGRQVDPEDEGVRSHLGRLEMREGIARYLARKIAEVTVERRTLEFERADFRLSETKPFSWRRDLPPLAAKKTVFNCVATWNRFERRFAEFLDRAADVLRFAALGTTEQGSSGTTFRVDYLKASGAVGFYYPDWVAVQRTDGEEVNWIIETKGRVWEGTREKDAAMRDWCRRVSAAAGATWRYARVNQNEFDPNLATLRRLLVRIVCDAMFTERDRRGTTLSRDEVRRARDEGRM